MLGIYIGKMEKKMETTIVYWCYIGFAIGSKPLVEDFQIRLEGLGFEVQSLGLRV